MWTKESRRLYCEKNKRIIRVKAQEYYEKNRERILEYNKRHRLLNLEKCRAKYRAYYHANIDMMREKAKDNYWKKQAGWTQQTPEEQLSNMMILVKDIMDER